MPLNMPANLTDLKNQLSQSGAWVWLLTISLPHAGPTFRFVANTENVVYGGDTYTAFAFAIDSFSCNADGEIPEFTMRVSNVGYVLQEHLRTYHGLIGGTISFVQVNTDFLAEDYSEDLTTLTITGAQNTWPDLELVLSVPPALRYRVPEDRLNPHACRHRFGTARCGYVGKSISAIVLPSGSPVSVDVPAIAAQGTLTVAVNPTDGNTMTLGSTTYRFKGTLLQANDIKLGTTLAATQASIVKTLSGTGVAGTDYFAGTTTPHPAVSAGDFAANASVLTARTAGAAGNMIVTIETFTSASNVFDAPKLGATTAGWEHGFSTGDQIRIETSGIAGLDGIYAVTVVDTDTFTLNSTDGGNYVGPYAGGGLAGYAHCNRIPQDCSDRGQFPGHYGGPLSLRREAVRYA